MKKIVFLLLVLLLFNCTKKTELKKKISDNDINEEIKNMAVKK